MVKTATSVHVDEDPAETDANYTIRSSVLQGEVISNVTVTGAISATYVRANGTVVAIENMTANPVWTHKDPAVTSIRSTDHNGQLMTGGISDFLAKELDPSGSEIGFEDPYLFQTFDPDPGFIEPFQSFGNLANGQATTLIVDGMQVPRNHFNRMNDFAFQGFFGRTERQAQQSRGTYVGSIFTYTDADGNTIQISPEQADVLKKEAPGSVTENRIFAVDVTDNSWAVNLLTPQSGNVALSKDANATVAKAISGLKSFKPSEKCLKKVIEKLADKLGFNLKDFQAYLESGYSVYDGTQSTVRAAGNIRPQNEADALYGKNATVADLFKDKDVGGIIRRVTALTSITAETFTAYFRPDALGDGESQTKALLFHEALHGFLKNGRTDSDIFRALGIDEYQDKKGKIGTPSSKITKKIKKYCF